MTSTCNRCGARAGKPQAAGLATSGLPAAVIVGMACGLLVRWSPYFVVFSIPAWGLLTWLLWEGPRWGTMLRNCFRRCPRCNGSDWSRPDYGGFGM